MLQGTGTCNTPPGAKNARMVVALALSVVKPCKDIRAAPAVFNFVPVNEPWGRGVKPPHAQPEGAVQAHRPMTLQRNSHADERRIIWRDVAGSLSLRRVRGRNLPFEIARSPRTTGA